MTKLFNVLQKYVSWQQMQIKAAIAEQDRRTADSLRSSLRYLQGILQDEAPLEVKELFTLADIIQELQYEIVEK